MCIAYSSMCIYTVTQICISFSRMCMSFRPMRISCSPMYLSYRIPYSSTCISGVVPVVSLFAPLAGTMMKTILTGYVNPDEQGTVE